MNADRRNYEAPVLSERGDVVTATRLKTVIPFEPSGMGLQNGPGDLGFGL